MLTLCVALLIGADVDPEPSKAVEVTASADYQRLPLARRQLAEHLVAREPVQFIEGRLSGGDVDWDKVSILTARALNVKAVDWRRQMIVVVAGSRQTSGGSGVEVVRIKAQGKNLKVQWKLRKPNKGADDGISYPATAVLLPAYKGKVTFERLEE